MRYTPEQNLWNNFISLRGRERYEQLLISFRGEVTERDAQEILERFKRQGEHYKEIVSCSGCFNGASVEAYYAFLGQAMIEVHGVENIVNGEKPGDEANKKLCEKIFRYWEQREKMDQCTNTQRGVYACFCEHN